MGLVVVGPALIHAQADMPHTVPHVVWGVSKHLAAGYLLYSLIQHARGRSPFGLAVGALLGGSMFPDLVDKPLAAVGVLGYGRSLGHSLLTAGIVLAAVARLADRTVGRETAAAFAVGYLSHVAVDMIPPLVTRGATAHTGFLFWPLVTRHELGWVASGLPVPRTAAFAAVMVAATALWLRDGVPPIRGVVA